MRLRSGACVIAVLLGAALGAGCDPNWEEPLPVRVAARADGDDVEIWTGVPCTGVVKVEVLYDSEIVTYRARQPQTVERWSLDSPPPAFRRTPRSPKLAWKDYAEVLIRMDGPGGQRSVPVDLASLEGAEGSDYRVGEEWLDEEEVLAEDGEDYELLCG